MKATFKSALLAVPVLALTCGCAAVRYADYKLPAVRFDGTTGLPLPEQSASRVQEVLTKWRTLDAEKRQQYPTPYHVYVDTPAPGTFEGEQTVGLAFSGGGTRGIVFGAACVKELEAREVFLGEVDYVSGVSTGAIPAALYALNKGPNAPPEFGLDRWPDCLNIDLVRYTLKSLAMRPDRTLRDFVFDMNSRPAMSSAFSAVYFGGNRFRIGSGMNFADLPRTPILLLGSTVISGPSVPFVQTRLPYRYAIDEYPGAPWGVGIQTFETFHADPMPYSLGEACYNSLSYPGSMRSGRLAVLPDREWTTEGLPPDETRRMDRARHQEGYSGIYEVKDGGLTDNRGVDMLATLFNRLAQRGNAKRPLLISIDASQLQLRAAQPGRSIPQGWFGELMSSTQASWQTGQDAHQRLMDMQEEHGAFDLLHIEYAAWVEHLPSSPERGPAKEETDYLVRLCSENPSIGTPERLLAVSRTIATNYTALTPEQLDAVKLSARFAVWHATR